MLVYVGDKTPKKIISVFGKKIDRNIYFFVKKIINKLPLFTLTYNITL